MNTRTIFELDDSKRYCIKARIYEIGALGENGKQIEVLEGIEAHRAYEDYIEWSLAGTDPAPSPEIKEVTIPACTDHQGLYSWKVRLYWICPVCGGPRGTPVEGTSYDGSLRLTVDTWVNDCKHIDFYYQVRQEARFNLLNGYGKI